MKTAFSQVQEYNMTIQLFWRLHTNTHAQYCVSLQRMSCELQWHWWRL